MFKYLALATVVVMVASAFALVSHAPSNNSPANDDENSARVELGGARTITYTIDDIGESYLKPTDYSKLGRHNHSQSGINSWFIIRNTAYNDTIIRNKYPYVVSYDPYSGNLNKGNPKYDKARWTTHSFYTLKIDAENITGLATGTGAGAADPYFLPIMRGGVNPQNAPGGWVNMSMYFTYLTSTEYDDIYAGTHYANSFYGVTPAAFAVWHGPGGYGDDGWLMEAQGIFDYNRLAANKFLGLPGTGNLITEFNAKGAAAVATQWRTEWINDGDSGMPLDIYAAYDFSILSGNGPVFIVVTLDTTNSTADKLVVRFWSLTWGAEALNFARYMYKVGITEELQPYMEDSYLNITFSPTMGDCHSKMTAVYHLTAWKDPDYFNSAWLWEPQNMDYTADNGVDPWVSYFDNYFVGYTINYKPLRKCWVPGQEFYGREVHFWTSPMNWTLDASEKLVIKMPVSKPGWGIKPYWSANFTLPGLSAVEQASNGYWGEWVLGHSRPMAQIYSATYYNAATKTLTWQGPMAFTRWQDEGTAPTYPATVNEAGSPAVMMDISRVSHYKLDILGGPTYLAGQTYVLQVTPQNLTNVNTYCNQTVQLPAVAGVTYGASSHTFLGNDTSWNTTISVSSAGVYSLVSNDQYFYLDITDTYLFTFDPPAIPEFPTLLIPVIGAAALVVVLRKRKSSQ